jgi:hypothetical protein
MKYIVEISKNGKATISPLATPSVTSMVKELEKALPKGAMVVVGNSSTPTEKNIADLKSIIAQYDKTASCGKCCRHCNCGEELYTVGEVNEVEESAYERGHSDGYEEGYADGSRDGYAECESAYEDAECEVETAMERVREVLEEAGLI